jgi:phage N-6-adenine-methyltransferase
MPARYRQEQADIEALKEAYAEQGDAPYIPLDSFKLATMRAMVDVAIAQSERGEGRPFDDACVAEIKARGRARLAAPLPLSTVSKQDWCTPRWIFEAVQARLGVTFGLDVAASAQNTLCERYYDGAAMSDGLVNSWAYGSFWAWCNPPYRRIMPWVEKALTETLEHEVSSVLLLPARLETTWYAKAAPYVLTHVITPRLAFEGGDGTAPPHGSMLLIVTPDTLRNPTGLHNLRLSVERYVKPEVP